MKLIILFAFVLCTQKSFSQSVVSYYDGTPALEVKHTNVEGTELLYPEWCAGVVKTKDGNALRGLKLKYNQLEDRLYYINSSSVSMMFVTPIKEFAIGDSLLGIKNRVFRNGFPVTGKFKNETYFEVLADGKIILLKKTIKNIIESKDYNSPVTKKQIIDDDQYYLYNDGQMFLVKKDKAAIASVLKSKAPGMEAYIAANKLNLKKEKDLINLVTYCNSL
ncbi:MAG: hypothetical protein JWR72_1905 [Flavisolibacter sp.]|jgi:hypothetical protein|nr:hypothetical protein [Flavisolibacter sp.]